MPHFGHIQINIIIYHIYIYIYLVLSLFIIFFTIHGLFDTLKLSHSIGKKTVWRIQPRIGPAHLMTALDTNGISISFLDEFSRMYRSVFLGPRLLPCPWSHNLKRRFRSAGRWLRLDLGYLLRVSFIQYI